MVRLLLLSAAAFALAACHQAAGRIRSNPEAFAALDPSTQEKVRAGQVDVGFSPTAVKLALGEPTRRDGDPAREATWLYRRLHQDPNDRMVGAHRRRVVFDPVRRGETVVLEPVDARTAARLAPYSMRVTFRDGRVVAVVRVPEI